MCHTAPHSPFTFQYREHIRPSFFFPSIPLLQVICVTLLLVFYFSKYTQCYIHPSFLLSLPAPYYSLWCATLLLLLHFSIYLSKHCTESIFILPSSFSFYTPLTVLKYAFASCLPFLHMPPRTAVNTIKRNVSVLPSFCFYNLYPLHYWYVPLLLVFHFFRYPPEHYPEKCILGNIILFHN